MCKLTNSVAGAVRASKGKFGKRTIIVAAAVACLGAAPFAQAGERGHDRDDRDHDGGGRYYDPRVDVIQGRPPRVGIDIRINSRDRFPDPDCRPAPAPVYEKRTERVWVEPTYRTVCDRVWVAPEYRTVSDRVWREPVVEDRCERVWVEPVYRTCREVQYDWCGRRVVVERREVVSPGHWEDRHRQVVVRDGCWETVTRQELVCDGHWQDVSRQELVCAGHWEEKAVRIPVASRPWDRGERRG